MAIVSRLELDHPALDDPGGNALHTQVEGLYIKIGDNLSARYFEGIAVANGATVIFDHNFKMPFDELAFKVYLLAGAGGELTVTTETDYDIVATPGNLTTQISVTNNSGGVSTFAVLIQSLGGAGGGGGGTELYDVVVDAAGGGDYTEIRAAILAEPTYSKIFIKDGSYSETLAITIKFGQKIVGQSKAGVILTTSALINLPGLAGNTRGVTQRTTDNTDWDSAASAGLITMTANNATASYSGSFLPVANDMCLIGPGGDMFDIISVSAPNVTLDRPWRGATGDVMDWIVLQGANFSDWKEEETWLKNMTIIMTNTNGSVFNMNRSWKNVLEDLDVLTANTNTGFAGVFYFADSVCKNTFKNISARCTGSSSSFTYEQNGGSNNKWINCSAEGMGSGRINGTALRPFKYMDFSFTDITQSGAHFIVASNFVVYSTFKVDRLDSSNSGIFPASGTSTVAWYSCEFVFGFVGAEVGLMSFNCGKSRLSIKRGLHTRTDIANRHVASGADPEFYNTLHDSNLSGTIQCQAAGDLIVSSSVTYGGFFNLNFPSYNVGFDFTDPPGGSGQTLYDAIVDAAGGGDYTSVLAACSGGSVGDTIYVRNGTYSETASITMKNRQKIIGESRDGVLLVATTGQSVIRMGSSETWGNVTATQYGTGYVGWSAANGLGTVAPTLGSAVVPYTGSDLPVAGDFLMIQNSPPIEILSVSAPNMTLVSPWTGATMAAADAQISPLYADDEDTTEIRNVTIQTILNSTLGIDPFKAAYGLLIENCKFLHAANTSTTPVFWFLYPCAKVDINNCHFIGTSTGVQSAIAYFNNHLTGVSFRDCTVENMSNTFATQSIQIPIKYCNFHFKKISGGRDEFWGHIRISHSNFHVEIMDSSHGWFTNQNGFESNWRCTFKFGVVAGGTGNFAFNGKEMLIDLGRNTDNAILVQANTATGTFRNIITGGLVGALTVDDSVVISGAVAYDSLSGAPAANNGHLY